MFLLVVDIFFYIIFFGGKCVTRPKFNFFVIFSEETEPVLLTVYLTP